MNYNPSTIARIGDIHNGIFVESGESLWSVWGEKVQADVFTVYNRVIIHGLFAEVTETILGAVQTVFNYRQTEPIIASAELSSAHATIANYVPGSRITYVGGSVVAAAITSALGAISYLTSTIPTILGVTPLAGVTSTGIIGMLSSVTDASDGTLKFGVLYTPIDKGAYIEALL